MHSLLKPASGSCIKDHMLEKTPNLSVMVSIELDNWFINEKHHCDIAELRNEFHVSNIIMQPITW